MKTIEFEAELSGDGSCFHWSGITIEQIKQIIGDKHFDYLRNLNKEVCQENHPNMSDDEIENLFIEDITKVYPGTLWRSLNMNQDKKYKFVISIEEVE